MLKKIRLGPPYPLLTLDHPREQKAMIFMKDFGRIVRILANPMRMANILDH